MNRIFLYGALKEEFGPEHHYVVRSPREAVRALCVNKPGFSDRIRPMELRLVRMRRNGDIGMALDENDMHVPMSMDTDVHVMPLPAGSKNGTGKVVLGIALVAATIFTAGAAAPGMALFGANGALAASTAIGISYGSVAVFGLGLALSGLSMMLAPSPQTGDPNENEDKKNSFLFNGPVNVSEQGHPEPLPYGIFRVGSVVISSSLVDEQILVGAGASPGSGSYSNVTGSTLGSYNGGTLLTSDFLNGMTTVDDAFVDDLVNGPFGGGRAAD